MAKILGLPPRTAMLAGGGAAAAAAIWFYMRRKNAGQPQGQPAPTGCTDGQGNYVPCPEQAGGIDYAGQLSVIQTELESVMAATGAEEKSEGDSGSDDSGSDDGKGKAPSPPDGGKVSAITKSSFRVTWHKSTGATSYHWRVTSGGKQLKSGVVTGLSATVSGLKASTAYTFHNKACNSHGCGTETAVQTKTKA